MDSYRLLSSRYHTDSHLHCHLDMPSEVEKFNVPLQNDFLRVIDSTGTSNLLEKAKFPLQSIADILSQVFYTINKLCVYLIPEYIFMHQEYGFPASQSTPVQSPHKTPLSVFQNGIYWTTIIRSTGICLLTFHRFLVIAKQFSLVTRVSPVTVQSILVLPFSSSKLLILGSSVSSTGLLHCCST